MSHSINSLKIKITCFDDGDDDGDDGYDDGDNGDDIHDDDDDDDKPGGGDSEGVGGLGGEHCREERAWVIIFIINFIVISTAGALVVITVYKGIH